MKLASIAEIKKELHTLSTTELIDLCLRLAKYKVENKELINYLIFEAHDETRYIAEIKRETEVEFKAINFSNLYLAKKSIRRILRLVKKSIKYSGKKETEVELLIFFCSQLQNSGIPFKDSKVLVNLYERQLQTIKKAMQGLHEDLQFDFNESFNELLI